MYQDKVKAQEAEIAALKARLAKHEPAAAWGRSGWRSEAVEETDDGKGSRVRDDDGARSSYPSSIYRFYFKAQPSVSKQGRLLGRSRGLFGLFGRGLVARILLLRGSADGAERFVVGGRRRRPFRLQAPVRGRPHPARREPAACHPPSLGSPPSLDRGTPRAPRLWRCLPRRRSQAAGTCLPWRPSRACLCCR